MHSNINITSDYQPPNGAYVIKMNEGKFVRIIACGIVILFDGDRTANFYVPGKYGEDSTGLCGECENSWKLCNGKDVSHMPKKARWEAIGHSCVADFPGFEDNG